jgi:hypothetical protein
MNPCRSTVGLCHPIHVVRDTAKQQAVAESRTLTALRISGDPNTKAPQTLSSHGTPVEQPSPEVCSRLAYVPTLTVGMAPTCTWRHCRAI